MPESQPKPVPPERRDEPTAPDGREGTADTPPSGFPTTPVAPERTPRGRDGFVRRYRTTSDFLSFQQVMVGENVPWGAHDRYFCEIERHEFHS